MLTYVEALKSQEKRLNASNAHVMRKIKSKYGSGPVFKLVSKLNTVVPHLDMRHVEVMITNLEKLRGQSVVSVNDIERAISFGMNKAKESISRPSLTNLSAFYNELVDLHEMSLDGAHMTLRYVMSQVVYEITGFKTYLK